MIDLGDASEHEEYEPYLDIKFKRKEATDLVAAGTMFCDDFDGGDELTRNTEMIFTPFVDYHMDNIPALKIFED